MTVEKKGQGTKAPYQDESGKWCCGGCGRTNGFKSRHAVLGHLRACRPNKPYIDALMADAGRDPRETGRPIYIPTQGEVTMMTMRFSLESMAAAQE